MSNPVNKTNNKNIKMKYLSLLIIALFITACGGDENYLTIEEYIQENNLETQVTASGLHYIINEPGGSERPTLSSDINIDYDGYFLGGGSFDGNNNVTFPLQNLIEGWKEGLQLIGRGGDITLLIPSQLAYGSQGSASIPGNTDIGFDIILHDFN